MNLNLPFDLNEFVKTLISQGRFDSEEAALVEGVRLLQKQESIRSDIQQGVSQLDRGEFLDESTVFDEVNAEIDRIEAERKG